MENKSFLQRQESNCRMVPAISCLIKVGEVGTVTSKSIKIVEKREVAGRVGDTVVYFNANLLDTFPFIWLTSEPLKLSTKAKEFYQMKVMNSF